MLNNRPQLDQKLGGQCSDIMQRQIPYINVIHVLERCSIVFYMVKMYQKRLLWGKNLCVGQQLIN